MRPPLGVVVCVTGVAEVGECLTGTLASDAAAIQPLALPLANKGKAADLLAVIVGTGQ